MTFHEEIQKKVEERFKHRSIDEVSDTRSYANIVCGKIETNHCGS